MVEEPDGIILLKSWERHFNMKMIGKVRAVLAPIIDCAIEVINGMKHQQQYMNFSIGGGMEKYS